MIYSRLLATLAIICGRDPDHLVSFQSIHGDLEDVVKVVDTYGGLEGASVRTRDMVDGFAVASTTIVDLTDAFRGRLHRCSGQCTRA